MKNKFEFWIDTYKKLRLSGINRITIILILGGLGLIGTPLWEIIAEVFLERELDFFLPNKYEPIIGIALILIALLYHYFFHLKLGEPNKAKNAEKQLDDLQQEIKKQNSGDGYIKYDVAPVQGGKFQLIITSKSNYPIYNVETAIFSQDVLDKCPKSIVNGNESIMNSCWKSAVIFALQLDIVPKLLTNESGYKFDIYTQFVHLMIQTHTRHNTIIQYSTIRFNPTKKTVIGHFFKIFEYNNGEYLLLEDDGSTSETHFENTFQYKKPYKVNYD
ncbi:hypothetical protein [Spongiimicrobium sp. 3-5]|uniref:hypothetical protein n=1 Tax=Spongiimicrobium sp. 3-5 TaxID=3332596 RepID=UPI00397F064A